MAEIQGDSIEAVAYQLYSDCRSLDVGAYGSAEQLLALYAECAAVVGAAVPDSAGARAAHSIGPVAYRLYADCKSLSATSYPTSDSLLELFAGCAAIVAAGSAHAPEEPAAG